MALKIQVKIDSDKGFEKISPKSAFTPASIPPSEDELWGEHFRPRTRERAASLTPLSVNSKELLEPRLTPSLSPPLLYSSQTTPATSRRISASDAMDFPDVMKTCSSLPTIPKKDSGFPPLPPFRSAQSRSIIIPHSPPNIPRSASQSPPQISGFSPAGPPRSPLRLLPLSVSASASTPPRSPPRSPSSPSAAECKCPLDEACPWNTTDPAVRSPLWRHLHSSHRLKLTRLDNGTFRMALSFSATRPETTRAAALMELDNNQHLLWLMDRAVTPAAPSHDGTDSGGFKTRFGLAVYALDDYKGPELGVNLVAINTETDAQNCWQGRVARVSSEPLMPNIMQLRYPEDRLLFGEPEAGRVSLVLDTTVWRFNRSPVGSRS